MRQMSGLGLLQHLKNSNCTVPVIMVVSMGQRNTQFRPTFIENKI